MPESSTNPPKAIQNLSEIHHFLLRIEAPRLLPPRLGLLRPHRGELPSTLPRRPRGARPRRARAHAGAAGDVHLARHVRRGAEAPQAPEGRASGVWAALK